MRRGLAILTLLAAAGVLAAAVPAAATKPIVGKTIVGTNRADVLRGTAGPDRIYGKGGNDHIYGEGGNDLIVGGPGVDTISCGPGRDHVIADHSDRIARDCEVVTYVGKKPAPKPAPPPPPPPAPPKFQVGFYAGTTSQQAPIVVQVLGSGSSEIFMVTYQLGETCGSTTILTVNAATPEFALPVSGAFDQTDGGVHVWGSFDGTGGVAGSIHVDTTASDGSSCSSGDLTWSARYLGVVAPAPPPAAADGHYVGTTKQGEQLSFDVVQGGRYVDSFTSPVDESCGGFPAWYPSISFGSTWILGGAFRDAFSFSSGGASSSASFGGSFDGTGGASGTLHVDTSGSDAYGPFSCSSGDVSWTAHMQ